MIPITTEIICNLDETGEHGICAEQAIILRVVDEGAGAFIEMSLRTTIEENSQAVVRLDHGELAEIAAISKKMVEDADKIMVKAK